MDLYMIALVAVNVITFLLYSIDKIKAITGSWRISERLLLALSFCTGGVGGLAAMIVLHHKTRHKYFWAVNIVGIVALVAAIKCFQTLTQ